MKITISMAHANNIVHGPDQIFLPLQGRNSDMYQFKD